MQKKNNNKKILKKEKYLFFHSQRDVLPSVSYPSLVHRFTELNETHAFHLDGTRINAMDQNLLVLMQILPLTSGRIWKAQGPFEHI